MGNEQEELILQSMTAEVVSRDAVDRHGEPHILSRRSR